MNSWSMGICLCFWPPLTCYSRLNPSIPCPPLPILFFQQLNSLEKRYLTIGLCYIPPSPRARKWNSFDTVSPASQSLPCYFFSIPTIPSLQKAINCLFVSFLGYMFSIILAPMLPRFRTQHSPVKGRQPSMVEILCALDSCWTLWPWSNYFSYSQVFHPYNGDSSTCIC